MSTSTTTLLCKQCNFENEPERVYCHNCGAKLDRSLLPPEATKREDPVVVQERLRRMTNPRRGMGMRAVKNFVLAVFYAAIIAFVIQAVRAPDGVPNLTPDQVYGAPMINDDMQTAADAPSSRKLLYTAEQVNEFLQYAVRGKEQSYVGISVKFERMFVHLNEGNVRIYVAESILGYSFYGNSAYTVQVQGGKIMSKNIGGGIGRVALPAFAGKALDLLFAPLWTTVDRYSKLVAKMGGIAFHKDAVEIAPPGAANAP